MIIEYFIQCSCGSNMTVRVDGDCKFLNIYCNKCKNVAVEHYEGRGKSFDSKIDDKPDHLENSPNKTHYLSEDEEITNSEKTIQTKTLILNKHENNDMTILDTENGLLENLQEKSSEKKEMPKKLATSLFENEGKKQEETIANPQIKEKKIGPYKIEKLLGKGGMGCVYLGIDDKNGEKVAVKLLNSINDKKAVEYFLRELQLLIQLNHQNIVKFKGKGDHNNSPYIAMEYIEGKSLLAIAKKNPLPVRHAVQVIYYILEALGYAQQFNFVHRDIKPENILLETQTKVVKLLDLGLGKIIGESAAISKTGSILGTPYYMAPEQITDAKHVDYRADVYGIGATLYYILTSTPPYAEHEGNFNSLLRAKLKNNYIPITKRIENLPRVVVEIVEKAMAHNPQDRYQNAKEMKEDVLLFWENYKK